MLTIREQAIEFIKNIPEDKVIYIMDLFRGIQGLMTDDAQNETAGQMLLKEKKTTAMGIFKSYANPSLMPLEKNAWAEAVKEKHANN